jgi:hypothetical protein
MNFDLEGYRPRQFLNLDHCFIIASDASQRLPSRPARTLLLPQWLLRNRGTYPWKEHRCRRV